MGRGAKDFPAADTNIFSGMPKVTCCGGWRQGTEVMEDQLRFGVEFVSDPRDRFYGFSFRAAARIGFAHSGTRVSSHVSRTLPWTRRRTRLGSGAVPGVPVRGSASSLLS